MAPWGYPYGNMKLNINTLRIDNEHDNMCAAVSVLEFCTYPKKPSPRNHPILLQTSPTSCAGLPSNIDPALPEEHGDRICVNMWKTVCLGNNLKPIRESGVD